MSKGMEDIRNQVKALINQAYRYGYKAGCEDRVVKDKSSKWIPVTERLPEDGRSVVLVTISYEAWNHEYIDLAICKWSESGKRYWEDEEGNSRTNYVTAWMPLPEPWKDTNEKQKEEVINVGDEVECKCPFLEKCVVVALYPHQYLDIAIMRADGYSITLSSENVKKTGRHFDEIAEVFKKMKEGDSE